MSGGNKEDGIAVVADDALKLKTQEAFLEEVAKRGQDIRQKAEEQKLNAAVPEEKVGKGDEVEKEVEEQPEAMDDIHEKPQKNGETEADQVLKEWAVPQGDEVRQVDEIVMEKPESTQGEELPRAKKVPIEAPMSIHEW